MLLLSLNYLDGDNKLATTFYDYTGAKFKELWDMKVWHEKRGRGYICKWADLPLSAAKRYPYFYYKNGYYHRLYQNDPKNPENVRLRRFTSAIRAFINFSNKKFKLLIFKINRLIFY